MPGGRFGSAAVSDQDARERQRVFYMILRVVILPLKMSGISGALAFFLSSNRPLIRLCFFSGGACGEAMAESQV